MFLFRVQNPLDLEILPACMLMNMEREANYGDFLLPCYYDQTDLVASLPAYRTPDFSYHREAYPIAQEPHHPCTALCC